jgi:lipoprotein-releasing system permease protein
MIRTIVYLGLAELLRRWRESLLAAGVVAVTLLAVLVLNAYRQGLEDRYGIETGGYLIAQSSGSLGEFKGSRLPSSVAGELSAKGSSLVVPQIHTIIGTSPENAILLRGIPLESYAQVEPFRIIDGRPLLEGDQPRLAMIGIGLAKAKDIGPGDPITIRGRPFTVAGVFAVDTYADFEAWIALSDAQQLLGWDSDVSVFVVPAGEGLNPGDTLPGGVSLETRGQTAASLLAEWQPLFRLLGMVTLVLTLAATIALANMLWRLAWLRRRQLAILRSLGYGRRELALYLLVQGAGITLAAFILGLLGALLFTNLAQLQGFGLTVEPAVSATGAATALLLAAAIALGASALPAWWLTRYNLLELIRAEV